MKSPIKYLLATAALICAFPAFADDKLGTPLEDRFRLTSGLFSARTATDIRIDPSTGPITGTEVSGESDLGWRDRSEQADVEAELRPRLRHKLRFGYFQSKRDASTVLDRQVVFGDEVYQNAERVESKFDVSDFNLTYAYMFLRRDRFELGASLGLHLYQFEAEASVPARLVEESEKRAGPVPAAGLEALVRITDRVHVEARGEYLNVQVDEVEGSLRNWKAAVFYRFNNNIAIGAGYMALNTKVLVTETGDSGRLNFDNRGGELLLRVSF